MPGSPFDADHPNSCDAAFLGYLALICITTLRYDGTRRYVTPPSTPSIRHYTRRLKFLVSPSGLRYCSKDPPLKHCRNSRMQPRQASIENERCKYQEIQVEQPVARCPLPVCWLPNFTGEEVAAHQGICLYVESCSQVPSRELIPSG